jgi:hypothetical protein
MRCRVTGEEFLSGEIGQLFSFKIEAALADVLIINSRKFVHWKADRAHTAWSA